MALPEGGEQQPERSVPGAAASPTAAEQRQIREDLQAFQSDLVAQLTADVDRLQQQKADLLENNRHLRSEQQDLQKQQQVTSRQQLAQQQQWAKQLAEALASRLYVLLVQKLEASQQSASALGSRHDAGSGLSGETSAIRDIIQNLGQSERSLAERLNRMAQLEQRSEALLNTLANRVEQRGQMLQPVHPESSGAAQSEKISRPAIALSQSTPSQSGVPGGASAALPNLAPTAPKSDLPAPVTPRQATAPRSVISGRSPFQVGLILILLSTVALSLHNVIVGIIGAPTSIFNIWEAGGFIELKSLDSSLLLLWLRMVIVMPLMAIIAGFIHPATWHDIRAFASSRDRKLLQNVCGSGVFLFMSQVLIYIAIGQIGPGIAVTILFMYPIITVPVAWLLFGDRPTSLRIGVMVAISLGIVLAAWPNLTLTGSISLLGVSTAVLAGIAFAFYLISMQLSFRRLHPVPVSVIQFFTIFLLTNLILLFRPAQIAPFNPLGLIVSGFILGTLTLVGYLLNNFGVRKMGAARASIVASSGPVLTALLAFLITPGPRTVLNGVQMIGILVVTLGVTALAFERLLSQQAKRRRSAAAER
ncbi:MAG: DMT family transporter [Elainellaceae cyanobacterium]